MKTWFISENFTFLKKAFIAAMALLCTGTMWSATFRWKASVTDGNWTDTNWQKEGNAGSYTDTTDIPGADDTVYIGVSSDTKITIPVGSTAAAKYVYTNSDDSKNGNLTLDILGTLTVTALYTNTGVSNSGNTTINISGTLNTLGAADINGSASTPSGIFTNSSYKNDTQSGSSGSTIINLSKDTTITNLYVNSKKPDSPNNGTGTVTINSTTGNKLTITGRIEMSGRANSSTSTKISITNSAEVSCQVYDPATKSGKTQTIDIAANAIFSIEKHYFGDAEATGISPFTGSGTLYIPASGANMNYGSLCGFTYDSNLKILPIGEPDLYTVSFSGIGNFPTSSISIVITRKNTGGAEAIYYPYKVSDFNNTASGTFSLDKDYSSAKNSQTNTTLSASTEGYLYIAGNKTSETISLSYSGSINGGDGFKIDIYTPDSARILSTLEWYSGKLTWTGETSVYWDETSNWIGLDGTKTLAQNLTGVDLIINASATRKPEIRNGTYSLKSLTIAPNASITISGGELTIPTFTLASTGNKASVTQTGGTIKVKDLVINGNSTFTATGGTFELSDASSTIEIASENNLSLYDLNIPSGKNLTVTTNGSDGKFSTAGKVTVEGGLTALGGINIKSGGKLHAKADNFNSSPLKNNGTVYLYTNVSSFGTFTNTANATIQVEANSITLPSTWTDFNGGNLTINTGYTGAKLGTAITNLNQLEIKNGAELSLETFDISPSKIINGGTLNIAATTLTLGTGTSYSGNGKIITNGGTIDYSGSAATINTLEISSSATLKGGTNGITVTNATYTSTPALTTYGKISIPGGTLGDLTIAGGTTTVQGGTDLSASSITINSTGNLTTAAGKTISLSGNWTNNAGTSGYTYTTSGTIRFTDTATITGATNFYNFSAENLSSKTLTINSDVTVNGTLKLSGADYSNPLTIDGTGTLSLAASQTGGKFLLVTDVHRISTSTKTYTATASRSTNATVPAGWIFINKYLWNGTGTNWNNASSWNINTDGANYSTASSYPQYSEDEVIIDNTSTNVAKLPSDLALTSVTVNAGATLDLLGYNLTVPAITNNGTIKLHGTQAITTSAGAAVSLTNGATSTIEYYGGTNAAPITVTNFFTKTFEKLKVNRYSTLQLGTNNLSATSLENDGTILINGSGTIDKTDNDSGLFVYSGSAAIKNYNADGTADYWDLQLSSNYTTTANVQLNVANKLTVDSGKTITLGGNLLASTIENNGKIVCGTKNLEFTNYSGTSDEITATTGTITSNSTVDATISALTLQGGNFKNNAAGHITITNLTLNNSTESSLQAGNGGITVTNALTTGKLATSGTVNLEGQLTGLKVSSDTTTASGDLTITGTSPYLTVNGTLAIGANNLKLTGTSTTNKVTVTGSGSITISSSQLNGDYIDITAASGPTVTGGTYTATHSTTATTSPVNGWNILSDDLVYVWNGSTSTSLTAPANWNTNLTPGTSDSIQIPALSGASPKYPLLAAATTFINVTVDSGATLDLVTYNLTATDFANNGKIRLSGANTITAATKAYGTANTIEYYGASSSAVTGTGAPTATDYKDLTIASGATLSLNASSITVGGTLSNEGTIDINGTGIFNIANSGTADSDSGLIKYSSTTATTKTIPNIGFYNLEISDGDWSDTSSAGLSTKNDFEITGGSLTCNGALTVTNALTINTSSDVKFNYGTGGQTSTTASATFTSGTIYLGNDSADSFSITGSGKKLELSGSATFHTAGTLSGAAGITLGKAITADAATTFSDAVTLSGGSAITNSTNAIAFSSTVDGGYALSTTGTGTVTFGNKVGGTTNLASINITGATNLNTTDVKTTGTQTFGEITLGSNAELTAGGTITLNGTVYGTTYNLTLTGDTTCSTGTIGVKKLTNSTGKTFTASSPLSLTGDFDNKGTFSSTAAANTLSVTGAVTNSGTISSAAAITISGSMTNTGTVNSSSIISLTGNLTDTSGTWTAGSIIFNGTDNQSFSPNTATQYSSVAFENTGSGKTVTIADTIKITSVTNSSGKNSNITFSKGSTITNAVVFNTTGTVTLGSNSETNTFTGGITHTTGTTTINGSVTTTDSLINLGTLNSAAGKSIVLSSGSGDITFEGTVTTTSLSATSTGSIKVNTTSVTTNGTQTFDGAVTVGNQATTFQGTTVHFTNTLSGQNALTITGKADFDDTVSGFSTLLVTETSNIAGNITTSDNQTYTGEVTLDGSDIIFTSGAGKLINFKAKLTGNSNDITINAANSQFDGAITLVKNLTTANTVLNETTTGIRTGNLTISGTADINKAISGFVDLSVSYKSNISANITTTGDQTYTGKVTLDGENLTFKSNSTAKIYFVNEVEGNSKDLTISTAESQFDGAVSSINNITTDNNVIFNGTVSCSGNLKSNGTTTVNSAAITTTGTQTYTSDLTISAETKLLASSFTANVISSTVNATIEAGPVNFNDDVTFTATNLTITNTGIFKIADNKNIICAILTQNGIGKNMLGGSLISTSGTWGTDLYVYGTEDCQITGTQTLANNLIIAKASATKTVTLNSEISAKNFVLYSGATTLNQNLSITQDVILLGNNINTTDQISGTQNAYRYNQNRYSGAITGIKNNYNFESTFPDTTSIPTNKGTLTIATGKKLASGKNFYANGLSITGDIQIQDNTDSLISFAEAYNCSITDSNVTAASGSAQIACENCTFTGTTTNWNQDELFITHAYTVRDNVVYVEFNRTIRNKNGELITAIENNYFTLSESKKYLQAFKDPDCFTPLGNSEEVSSFYLKSEVTWNTDATGSDPGKAESTNRYGEHQTATPFIDIVRNNASYSWLLTDVYGKRLENYSSKTTTIGVAYGNTGDASHGVFDTANHIVEDKTGPVLYSVRTGQELHVTPDGTAASQHSYDSHNFIEFRYSEPTNFGSTDSAICDVDIQAYDPLNAVNIIENIQVTSKFGSLTGNIESTSQLNFIGLGTIQSGKIFTGKDGSTNKYVNALYRTDEYSLRLSIAGYTNGTVFDGSGNEFKKWIGYIESAVLPSGTVTMNFTTTNALVYDQEGNPQENYIESAGSKNNTIPIVNCQLDGTPLVKATIYGDWDTSEPIFSPLRMQTKVEDVSNWTSALITGKYESEAIGNNAGIGTTLDRIEFHILDNTPSFDENDIAEWVSEIGWCIPGSNGTKAELYDVNGDNQFYTADMFGGSRQFAIGPEAAYRTSGGIRYCTVYNSASAFKYTTDTESTPNQNFDSGVPIYDGSNAIIFSGTSSPRRSALELDGLYFGVSMGSTSYDIKTQFTVTYDSSNSYITDLAGNRLRSTTFTTIDRTPPSFDITLASINGNEIFITFVKELITDSSKLIYIDNTTNAIIDVENFGTFQQILPYCFKIISIDENGLSTESTSLQIDTSIPAEIVSSKTNSKVTSFKLHTTRNITLEDIETLYIAIKNHPDFNISSRDPLTNHMGAKVTFIQDQNKNYMEMYSAHALSDFAINVITPLYAYDENMSVDEEEIMNGLYEDGSWAVHDWNKDQKNYGTLPKDHEIAIIADIDDGTTQKDTLPVKAQIYLSDVPTAGSVSTQYNQDLKDDLRIWLPNVTDLVFSALSEANNKNFATVDSQLLNDSKPESGFIFHLPENVVTKWESNSQISFLFGLRDINNEPINIIHSPELDLDNGDDTNIYYLRTSKKYPLYSLRLKNSSDITSIDLWSFKVKSITNQRGGVTILNNVINNSLSEKTIVKVNLPTESRLNVIVMTLDGNVVKYLNRGLTPAGEHYYSWDGKNQKGNPVARGMYFIRVSAENIDETRKVMVVK